ncbi:TPA: hypothetical protein LUC54_003320 [Acinetobacter baumannii]|uniref:Uncharacterized protein n=3 Tax=Acinetobacter baumannii TaxID=470 RepID=D0CFN9_ACIB2|nr:MULTISPECIES: hypothetical protein [Acinetobacter calcoaceticus/baumannii complex]ARN31374.1 hypothetical protein A4U85_11695 [Acinetobacter baumannii]EEX01790.1 hypothetical protein HMPREF0010_03569 [Acinetobacter baumannii ATCC 19606 = CIP 70.34 = JCM 6841]EKV1717516.1 hypothetical protein [Acinetobacter baumannii]EKV3577190.1 hypothetical protein [Acinetobacter baumannii]EKX0078062.1 hypothetical protein [Acinetobacter baumannii]
MSNQVEVVAIKKGFYHGIRDVGTKFFVPSDLLTGKKTWFKPVNENYVISEQQNADPNNPYTRMNKDALTQAAVEQGIQLTGAETKAQIIELLTAE